MKKFLLIALIAVAAVALSTSAFAVIAGSLHDLSGQQGASISACEFCHTPHNARASIGVNDRTPLWNRTMPAGPFNMYGVTVSGTTADTSASSTPGVNPVGLGANSKTCLSCHDGVTALGALLNKATETGGFQNMTIEAFTSNPATNLGTDLSDDHPIGFIFHDGNAGVPQSVFGNVGGTGPFRLYERDVDGNGTPDSYTFECASCHDPHDTTTGRPASGDVGNGSGTSVSNYFLRAAWDTICTDCHTNK